MKKFTRHERKIYKQGQDAGFIKGYLQGLEDGNPFNQMAKAVRAVADSMGKFVKDPAFLAALEKAREIKEENGGELLGRDHDLIITDEIKPEGPPTNET